jgi:putative transposase
MPRRLRIEFEGAIYHVMARGNARQKIVRDDADRQRLIEGLEQAVIRYGWEIPSYVVMGNHLHLLVKTLRPNLGAGMQSFLSGYAIWSGRRWRRTGHLFQGRYRTEMIEDESYYWTVSRYIHLNPVRAGLVKRPEQWAWSSYPGYRDRRRAQNWVAHDQLLGARQGARGGKDARTAYVRFVDAGIEDPPPPPFRQAVGGWILGSEEFVARLRKLAGAIVSKTPIPEARRLASLDPKRIFAAVVDYYEVEPALLAKRHDPHIARAVAAWMCRRHTEATLAELAEWLGLSRADSVPNLTRRVEAQLKSQPELLDDFAEILRRATSVAADHGRIVKTPKAPGRQSRSQTKTNADTAKRPRLTPQSAPGRQSRSQTKNKG